MSAADEVAIYIRASLLELDDRVETSVVIDVAKAIISGAHEALAELEGDSADQTLPGSADRTSRPH